MADFHPWRTFSIFISSCFADMQAERDYLKHIIFPRIDEELKKRRIRLEIVDLRWGVDTTSIEQEEEREATVLKVCLDEIKRCHPFFIGLLGDRYGWIPSEERIKTATAGESLNFSVKGKSVTALEIEFGVLASQDQLTRSVFYFRQALPYEKFSQKKAAMFSNMHNHELSDKDKKERKTALDNLKITIKKHFENKGLSEKVKTYTAIWDEHAQRVIGLDEWGEMVYADILSECEKHAKDTWDKVPKNIYEQEQALLDAFVEPLADTFCGREELIEELKQHLLSENNYHWGLFLTGESGTGKSAIFSKVYKTLQQHDCFILAHSAGISPQAKNISNLIQKWNSQLEEYLGNINKEENTIDNEGFFKSDLESEIKKSTKPDIEKLQEKFRELLFTIAEKKRVVILIDALDCFEPTERAKYMSWLPTVMPAKLRMLCTAITGTEIKAIQYHSGISVKEIKLFSRKEAKNMLETLSIKHHKNLPHKVAETILGKQRNDNIHAASSPLWLSLAINILMTLDQDDFEKMSMMKGRGDIVIEDYLQRLAQEFSPQPGNLFLNLINKAGNVFGEKLTKTIFKLIACSRNGLRESDLQMIISNITGDQWDPLRFAGIRRWFQTQMVEHGEDRQWNLAHSILRNTLIENINIKEQKDFHNIIASHLITQEPTDRMRINEIMHHFIKADNKKKAADYYASELNEEEETATAKNLAEYINSDKKGLKWVSFLLKETRHNIKSFQNIAKRYIEDINDSLEIEGRLDERKTLLEYLRNEIELIPKINSYNQDIEENKTKLYSRLGTIYQALGIFDKALEYYKLDLYLTKKLLKTNSNSEDFKNKLSISYSKLGDIHQASGLYDLALKYFEMDIKYTQELFKANPDNEEYKNGMAISYSSIGDIHKELGKYDKAMKYLKLYNKLTKELHNLNPKNEEYKTNLAISFSQLGFIYQDQGEFNKAKKYFGLYCKLEEELYRSNPKSEELKNNLAISYSQLGDIHKELGEFDKALKYFELFNKLETELYQHNPKSEEIKNNIAISYSQLGIIHQESGEIKKALQYLELFKNSMIELCKINPNREDLKKDLSSSYSQLGNIHQELGQFNKSLKYFELDLKIALELYKTNPKREDLKNGLAASYSNLGDLFQEMGQFNKALKYYELFRKLILELYKSNPKREELKQNLSSAYSQLGNIHKALGKYDTALEYLELDIKLAKELYKSNPKREDLKNGLASSYSNLGDLFQEMGQFNKTLEYYELFKNLMIELNKANPNREELKQNLASSYSQLGIIHQELGQFDRALEYLEMDIKLAKKLCKANPQSEDLKNDLAKSYSSLGDIYEELGQFDKALECFYIDNKLCKELCKINPKSEELKINLATSYSQLGYVNQQLKQYDKALEYYELDFKIAKELYKTNPKSEDIKKGLSISFEKLGDVHKLSGQYDKSLKFLKLNNKLTKELCKSNPKRHELKKNLASSYSQLGDLHLNSNQLNKALVYFELYNELSKELYSINPQNINLSEELGRSFYKLAITYKKNNQLNISNKCWSEWRKHIEFLHAKFPQIKKYSDWYNELY